MSELPDDRVNLVVRRVQTGLQSHADEESRTHAVALAERLVKYADEDGLNVYFEDEVELPASAVSQVDTDTLRRLRKITEILEDDLNVDLGHSKFTQLATTGAKLSSIAALAVASYNLLEAAADLHNAASASGSLEEIEEEYFANFYGATCVFVLECFFFTTPINFQFAWRGTRYLNNRYLFRIREIAPSLHRYVLSEVHYVIRGIGPAALRHVDHFTSYLVSVTVWTIEMLDIEPKYSLEDLGDQIRETVETYISFVTSAYEIAIPDLSLENLFREILSQIQEFRSITNVSGDDLARNTTFSANSV